MNEEKKLTDDEIVKALEYCAYKENGCSTDCPLIDIENCTGFISKNALDLIHRLKKENEELKSPKFASWKLKFFNLKEEFDKELAEHEEFAKKAKAEIERLKIDIKNEKNWGKIQTKQAGQSTAKEIFTDLLKEFSIRKSCGNADVVVREMASRKGVEVE